MSKRKRADGGGGALEEAAAGGGDGEPPRRRSDRPGRGERRGDQDAAPDDEVEEPEHNIFGTGPGTQRVGKVLLGWAGTLLDGLLAGALCPTARAQITTLARRLETECDLKIRRHSHLFDHAKCVEVIEDRAQAKSRSGQPIGAGPEPRLQGRPANPDSRRSKKDALDVDAVARRGVREAEALELETAAVAKEEAFLAVGRQALAAMTVFISQAGLQQIPVRQYEAARTAHTAALAAQSPLVALKIKAADGRALAGQLQDTITLLKSKAVAVRDWPVPAAPPGHVFIPSQEDGHGARLAAAAAAAAVAPAAQGRARANLTDIKNKTKAFRTASKALGKQVHLVGALATILLAEQSEDLPKPRFVRVPEPDRVSEEGAKQALELLRKFMLQRREEVGRADLDALQLPALYVMTTMPGNLPTIKTCTNPDPFLRDLISTLVVARHESPAQVDREAERRRVRKVAAGAAAAAAAAAGAGAGAGAEDEEDDEDDDDDDSGRGK